MTVLCKDEKFVDVISGSIVVLFENDSWEGNTSEVIYALEICYTPLGGFRYPHTRLARFATRDLKKAYSVLQAMLAAMDSGVEEWEVPIC